MIDIFGKKVEKKSRKYPIKRDQYGKSARQRAFEYFNKGKRPAKVAHLADISLRTACRYHADWKKQPKNFKMRYQLLKASTSNPKFRKELYKRLAIYLGLGETELAKELQKPYGLRQLLFKKWTQPVREDLLTPQEIRLAAALDLIDMFGDLGLTQEEIEELTSRFIREIKSKRKSQVNEGEAKSNKQNK